jgi:ketosteroid isomerase-like protein
MKDVRMGKGKLASKGVYAARDFKKGELVVPYNLKELTQTEFDALPHSEREFTHSFWGKIFLFSKPERYVNHSDDPNTFPDLNRMGDYALRLIKKGEAVTINDKIELQHELDTFLEAYEDAANSRQLKKVAPFIAHNAVFQFTNGTFVGKQEIKRAFENTWGNIKDAQYTISNVRWIVATYWVSVCSYRFKSDGIVKGKRQVYEGYGTNVLKRVDGNWRIVHEHLSKAV